CGLNPHDLARWTDIPSPTAGIRAFPGPVVSRLASALAGWRDLQQWAWSSLRLCRIGFELSADDPYTDDELQQWGLERTRLPRHVAVIMDGNGRWARSRGLPRIEGHRRGVMSVRTIVEECARMQLQQLTLYCFSSENWK